MQLEKTTALKLILSNEIILEKLLFNNCLIITSLKILYLLIATLTNCKKLEWNANLLVKINLYW